MIKKSKKNLNKIIFSLAVILLILVIYNQIQIFSLTKLGAKSGILRDNPITGDTSASSIIPKGTPKIYGNELDIKYDDVSPYNQKKADSTISLLGSYDTKITLKGKDLERYVNIVSKISCEYCCGAKSIIFTNEDVENMNAQIKEAIATGMITEQESGKYKIEAGAAACGCAHSFAMRGLAKYLITKHGNKFSDDEILEELGKWKTLFFPNQIHAKSKILEEKGIQLNYINLASNKYRDIEKGYGGESGMVGGC